MASGFGDDVKRFAAKANLKTEKAVRGTSIKLFGAIIQSTPVLTGRARANWQLSGSKPATGTVTTNDSTGTVTTNKITTGIASALDWSQFTLTNNLPYIVKLEYGYSEQAPTGMVRTNVARFEKLLNEEAKKNG